MLRYLNSSLFLAIIALMGIGLVQVYSSSFIFATESFGDGLFFFKRQLLFTLIAFSVMVMTIHIPFEWIRRWGVVLWLGAFFMMLLTFVPGIGVRVGGALRWIQLPFGLRFEPSELLKISFSLLFATLLIRNETILSRLKKHWLALAVLVPVAVLLKQRDFGSFAIIIAVGTALLFAFGLKWRYIIAASLAVVGVSTAYIATHPYAKARIHGFLDPWADPEQKGFQVIQSMLSFSSGGLTGAGLGKGQGKLFFLPEAHTDFTLAVFGEEMGFIGFVVLLSLYGFVIFRGIQIAVRTEDTFKRALSLGLSLTFALSVFINCGVVMGLLPTKGLTLPFMSYGGSSLVVIAFMFGLILNIENSFEEDTFSRRYTAQGTRLR